MSEAKEPPITARELEQCGMCVDGQRRWFKEHGLDFRSHVKNGSAAKDLLAAGDGLAIKAVDMVMARRGK